MSTPPDNNSKTPGQGLDTGTGGFPVGQNNELYTYGVGDDDSGANQTWSPGNVNVDKNARDLSRKTKSTLAAYLSDTTLGKTPSSPVSVRNKYPVNHVAGSDPDKLSVTDEKGYPTSPDRNLDGHINKFVPGKVLESRSKADTNLKIKRGRQDGNRPDGNDLLPGVSPIHPAASAIGGKFTPEISTVSIPQNSPIKQYYGSPNLSNSVIYNRFNPEGNEYRTLGSSLNSSQFAKKYDYGTSQANRDMSYGRLAQVGSVLSTRASAEPGSLDSGYNPSKEFASATAPGLTQLGLERLDRKELDARSVIDELTKDAVDEGALFNPAGQSWGTLNNVNDQFSVSNTGMQLLAVALLVALSVVILALSAIFSIGSPGTVLKQTDVFGRRPYGASRYEASSGGLTIGTVLYSIWQSIGVENTSNPLNVCIPTGALLFFGMAKLDVTSAAMAGIAALNGLNSVSQSPGYYAVLGRLIGRSFLQIGDSFSRLGQAFGAGALSGISQIFATLDSIKSTKFMKIINIFAHVGDQYIDVKKENSAEAGFSAGFGMRFTSKLDKISNDSSLKGRMMRVTDGINPLTQAWASYRAPDLFIVPKGLQIVEKSPNAKKLGIHPIRTGISSGEGGLKDGTSHYDAEANETRISSENREYMERMLDAEYVPFYIHDVRTNEIVSFHAFLASLTDDYSANYDQSESFGRVEAIKIYKSTNRKISFSFYVAATNSSDFDAMWLKINKLTTMVYPQFSEGRTITNTDGYKVYVPFSQTIQASPLVRVRIGDLITSNYSKFNLARLFGYTYPETKFDGKELPNKVEEFDEKKRTAKLGQLRRTPGTTFVTDIPLNESVPRKKEKGGTRMGKAREESKRSAPLDVSLPRGLVLSVVKDLGEGRVECEVKKVSGLDAEGFLTAELVEIEEKYGNSNEPLLHILRNGYNYILNDYDLTPSPSTQEKMNEELSGEYSLAVKNFMIDNNVDKGNAVARSFRSSGGKGIAGFIDSLSFDWYDKVTWVTDEGPGRKAPKMCKVSISFSPIHDITPGLDHMGANRAPIYTVKGTK